MNYVIIFFLIISFIFYFLIKYLIYFLKKRELLIDRNFIKPQSFHLDPTPLAGGLIIISFFTISCFIFFNEIIFDKIYLFLFSIFFIGFLDDVKVITDPFKRFLILSIITLTFVVFTGLNINNVGFWFFNLLINNYFISLIFTTFCILFVINGSNFIDGFNGLLGIHSILILFILAVLNFSLGQFELSLYIFTFCISILIFLLFNFPFGITFLGDSGSYLLGCSMAIFCIKTNTLNLDISPVFFAVLLYYTFFEVFFSYIRKFFYEKSSPFYPDKMHLHMLIFRIIDRKLNNKIKSNYLTSVVINTYYLITIFPVFLFYDNSIYCLFYFFLLILSYVIFYVYLKINE